MGDLLISDAAHAPQLVEVDIRYAAAAFDSIDIVAHLVAVGVGTVEAVVAHIVVDEDVPMAAGMRTGRSYIPER